MRRQVTAPGREAVERAERDPAHRFAEVVDEEDLELVDERGLKSGNPTDQYLRPPDAERLGICCSGGGIRSASYALGALQVLRHVGWLSKAEYLAAVSGGDYMAVAHAILVSESLKAAAAPEPSPTAQPAPKPDPEDALFGALPPWAPRSPEEQHLRDHTTYLAAGLKGKAWAGLNVVYGMLRHMIPFGAGITLTGTVFGLLFAHWIGRVLRKAGNAGGPPGVRTVFVAEALVLLALALVAGGLLIARGRVEKTTANEGALWNLQTAAILVLGVQAALAVFGMGLPALLLILHDKNFLVQSAGGVGGTAAAAGAGSIGVASLLGYLAKRGVKSPLAKKLVPKLMPLALTLLAPIVVGVPLVGVTYLVAFKGWHLYWSVGPSTWHLFLGPGVLIGAPLILLAIYWLWLDEVTSNMHLFYREQLSTVFAGLRTRTKENGRPVFHWGQPDWSKAIKLSEIERGTSSAKLPNLVVCAAINVSDDVLPPGRLAAPFTFERHYSGGPLTGYVPTHVLESAAGPGVLTLPAMMAISGAAVSPSMGKMTRPWARFLLALFNGRLGVWVPNPLLMEDFPDGVTSVRAHDVPTPEESATAAGAAATEAKPLKKRRRPGTLYVLWEALGLNHLGRHYVYATDGGHWDNLGLVELLRRGCGRILCFDAAGDDLTHFHTLSEAIELARSDLGVEIHPNLEPLTQHDDGFSAQPFATACIHYPNGTRGILMFAKAALTRDMPQDAFDWKARDPRFPTNSTVDQWFSDRQFESYRVLGAHAALRVACTLEEFDEHPEKLKEVFDLCPTCPSRPVGGEQTRAGASAEWVPPMRASDQAAGNQIVAEDRGRDPDEPNLIEFSPGRPSSRA